ncbi:hypothetical protein D8674_039230 [Pyrus ussuriensis x Pyrus communis]|uniref:Replication protein A 70 kDa DNA-binding subunit B/D first OB fold domain-containing protein n=1 Tax=Pyrus ussuriensis x Pyrus communis TaxID=2448454 RepID=A0A5N5FTM3_9ROSA|nr:hypothetical protein D8674_039215 [Pyrus ussuriensis x Pyrus communis]KAB2604552.1 hypothetical protein D8674_039230 [Pyrus ussuriensis x Pyrus communis]
METIEVNPIAKLRPYIKAEKIKIRVCRIWKYSISATVRKYVTLQCILVDETNNAVEASASDIDYELVASKIDVGSCYEIMNFRTIKIIEQYKVVPHKTQVIFTGTTVFKKLSTVFPPIPRHRFFILDFNMLYSRLNRDDILTDVIGHITAVQQLESKQINQRIVQKCDIHIENIRKKELSVTLWADIAEAFCSLSIQKLSLPIIVVFTSLKVKIYLENIVLNSTSSSLFFIDPDCNIPFSTCKVPVKILPPSSRQANEAEILRTASRVTIDELAILDPDLYKNDTFLCKASIKRFDTRYDLWYNACPSYVKQMHKDPSTGQLICEKHPNQIPTPWYKVNLILEDSTNEISALIIGKAGEKLFGMPCKDLFLRLIGQKKIFHLRFGNRKNSFNSSDVLVYNVSDDTAIEPITPQILPRAVTVSSTTVLSLTSPPKTSRESHKRKRKSVRKALFTGSEQSEAGEISEVDPKEFDEIPIKLLEKKNHFQLLQKQIVPPKIN